MKNFLADQQNLAENQEDDKWVNEFINESLAPARLDIHERGEQEDFWKDFQYEWSSAEGEL